MRVYGVGWPLLLAMGLVGCATGPDRAPTRMATEAEWTDPLLERGFVFEVLRHVYRWHFDQSYLLEAGDLSTLDVWARRLHPPLDPGDRSEFAELWIPAVKTRVDLKWSNYAVPEMNLEVVDRCFKVQRVVRQVRAPASRSHYQVARWDLAEVRNHLFATRNERLPVSESVRTAARRLVVDYLNRVHPEPFREDQVYYVAPLSAVSNDLWVFWETGRKLLLFSADTDLASPGFSQLSQLRMEVIDLEQDVVASTQEVPGSNAYVTKDWVGRLFYNCLLFGERLVRTPEELSRVRTQSASAPTP